MTATGQGMLSQSVDLGSIAGTTATATLKQTTQAVGSGGSPASFLDHKEVGGDQKGGRETFVTAINSRSRLGSQMLMRNHEKTLLEKANDALKRLEIALFRTFQASKKDTKKLSPASIVKQGGTALGI